MWVTADGHIRQELLSNGRYDGAWLSQEPRIGDDTKSKPNHIDYWDDTGFTADGTFVGEDDSITVA